MRKGKKNICPRCKSEIPEGMAFCQYCMEIIENNSGVVEIESRYKPKVNKWFMAVVITALCILVIMFAVIILILSNPDKKEQSLPEMSPTEQVTTADSTGSNTTTTATEEVFTEIVTEEMPTVQVPQADFETIIRNGFDSWTGSGDAETLSFDGYSCTFSDTLMGEYINCALTVADDFRSYVLALSGTEYSTGSFVNGIDEPVRAFAEIVLGYKSSFMGGSIRGSIREMLNSNETSCNINDGDFSCDIEYDSVNRTVVINAYVN